LNGWTCGHYHAASHFMLLCTEQEFESFNADVHFRTYRAIGNYGPAVTLAISKYFQGYQLWIHQRQAIRPIVG